MPQTSPQRKRIPPLTFLAVAVLAAVASILVWQQLGRSSKDQAIAIALATAMTAPRAVLDGFTLEARHDAVVADLASERRTSTAEIRRSLERYASGGLLGTKRTGFDAFLAQVATRRFEIAIGTLRDLAAAAKERGKSERPSWRLLADAALLELGRGRASAAEPLLQQAFEQANRADALDTLEAAALHTGLGAVHLSRAVPAEAEPYFRRAASVLRSSASADLRDTARAVALYGQAVATQGFPEEAEVHFAEALRNAAQFRRATGRPDAAEPNVEEIYRKLLRARGLADAEIAQKIGAVRGSN